MTELNPYQSPDAEVTTERPLGTGDRVYKPWHVGLATFLGTPLAGFWIIGTNYVALGEPERRSSVLWLGVGGTVLLLVAAYFVPDGFPSLGINIAVVAGMVYVCKSMQGDSLQHYVEDEIQWYSAWRAAGIGIICLIVLIAIIVAFVFGATLIGITYFIE